MSAIAFCFIVLFALAAIFVILYAVGPLLPEETPEEKMLREIEFNRAQREYRERQFRKGGPTP